MVRDFMLRVRLTGLEKDKLQAEAERRSVSMSEVIQDYIKRLPSVHKKT